MGNRHSTKNAIPLQTPLQQPLIGDNASNANLHITNNLTMNFQSATLTMEDMGVGDMLHAGARLNDEQIRSNIVEAACNFVDAVKALTDKGVPKDQKISTYLAEVGALSAPECVHGAVTLTRTKVGKILRGAVLTGSGHALVCTGGAANVLGIHFLSDALKRYRLEGKFRQDMLDVLDNAVLRFQAVLDGDFKKDFSDKGREKAKNVFESHIEKYQKSIMVAGEDIDAAKRSVKKWIEMKDEDEIIFWSDRLIEKIRAYYEIYSQFGKIIENATKQACTLAQKSRRRALCSFVLALMNGAGLGSVYTISNVTNVYTAVIFGGICLVSMAACIYLGCKLLQEANIAEEQVKQLERINDAKNTIQKSQKVELNKTLDEIEAGSGSELFAKRRRFSVAESVGAESQVSPV